MEFHINTRVRYKPKASVYGYEHLVESDGRVPAIVIGHSLKRVRIEFNGRRMTAKGTSQTSVLAENLIVDSAPSPR